MRTTWFLLAGLLLLTAGLALQASAHDGPSIAVEAPPSEQCESGKDLCFRPAAEFPQLQPGDEVDLVFYNDDDAAHMVMVTPLDQADPDREDTPRSVALTGTMLVEPGDSSNENLFTVPEDAQTLYIWCDQPGHEAAGMWIEVPVQSAAADGEANGTPVPWWIAATGLLAGAALLRDRQGRE